jgi:hypothetical protein
MSGPNGERCGFCYYLSDPQAVEPLAGWCNVNAPPYTKDRESETPWHPLVSVSGWCVSFKIHPNLLEKLEKSRVIDHETKFKVEVINE